MTISVGATTGNTSAATTSTTGPTLSFTPDAGANKRVIAAVWCYTTVGGATGPISCTFGGNAMTKRAEYDNASDPSGTLAVFEYDVGSSTSAGTVAPTSTASGRWNVVVFNLIDVPSQTPVSNTAFGIGSLSVSFSGAGMLLDFAAVNTDDSSNTNNTITIDGAQTSIASSTRGSGTTTEGRLAASSKTVASGSQSGANSSPFTDGSGHVVLGYLDSVGGPTYTLTADQGSYALTGQTAALLASRRLAVDSGSYALTGYAANLVYTPVGGATYTLVAGSGSYALTGQAAGLRAARKLVAAQGSYGITGQAAGLYRGYVLTAAQGSYTLTGRDAAFRRGYALTAASGAYTLTGYAATLTYSGQGLWTVQAPASTTWNIEPAAGGTWTVQ